MQAIFPRDGQGVQIGSFQLDMILMPEEMLRQAAIFLHSFDPSWKWAMTAPAWQYPCWQMLLRLGFKDLNKVAFFKYTSLVFVIIWNYQPCVIFLSILPDAIKMYGSLIRDFRLGASSLRRSTLGCSTSSCKAIRNISFKTINLDTLNYL